MKVVRLTGAREAGVRGIRGRDRLRAGLGQDGRELVRAVVTGHEGVALAAARDQRVAEPVPVSVRACTV